MTAPFSVSDRPRVRLRPKVDARRIRHGFPWAYANEIVTDRRTKAITPGTVAVLEDADRTALALVAVNPLSKIFARVLDRDPGAQINADWCAVRLRRAAAPRIAAARTPF